MATHTLKTIDIYWDAVSAGLKRFEVRRNDRAFQSGDTVILRRTEGSGYYSEGSTKFSTRDLTFTIGWMLQGGQFGIEVGFCVFQLIPTPTADADG